jgi:hypothetical protein
MTPDDPRLQAEAKEHLQRELNESRGLSHTPGQQSGWHLDPALEAPVLKAMLAFAQRCQEEAWSEYERHAVSVNKRYEEEAAMQSARADALVVELAEAKKAASEREEAIVNEIWDDVLHAVQQAWPEPQSYADCPTELIARVIDEKKSLAARLAEVEGERERLREGLKWHGAHHWTCAQRNIGNEYSPNPTNGPCNCGYEKLINPEGQA